MTFFEMLIEELIWAYDYIFGFTLLLIEELIWAKYAYIFGFTLLIINRLVNVYNHDKIIAKGYKGSEFHGKLLPYVFIHFIVDVGVLSFIVYYLSDHYLSNAAWFFVVMYLLQNAFFFYVGNPKELRPATHRPSVKQYAKTHFVYALLGFLRLVPGHRQ